MVFEGQIKIFNSVLPKSDESSEERRGGPRLLLRLRGQKKLLDGRQMPRSVLGYCVSPNEETWIGSGTERNGPADSDNV